MAVTAISREKKKTTIKKDRQVNVAPVKRFSSDCRISREKYLMTYRFKGGKSNRNPSKRKNSTKADDNTIKMKALPSLAVSKNGRNQ
jgi:hypothetical protein